MSIWEDTDNIAMYVHWDIPHLQLKVYVHDNGKYSYRDNGLSFVMIFQDLHSDPAQCSIKTGTNTALTGGASLTYDSKTTRAYGKNLMFEPVPLEMLYHDADKPQVMIKVKGIEGLCPGFNCDYLYAAAPSEITAQALASEKEITITGTSLPTTGVSVVLGNAKCGTVTATETEIKCTLATLPAAGSWDVKVYEPKGLVPVKAGTAKIDVALEVTSITPSADLNQLGGDVLTIVGKGFDSNTAATTITFSDTTKCKIASATAEQIKCTVEGFKKDTIKTDTPYSTTISVNTVTNNSKNVNLKATKQSG
mmetsp:Transcript_33613/g.44334  ORF Transcript_33613/g.44334 Transcript_33613/m.44334 type:complete len:308 (-) Transcript_33613:8160-9083(-)